MKRREFVAGLGGAVAWPVVARAQQQGLPVIGFLGGGTPLTEMTTAFSRSLSDAGYFVGHNVAIEYRWADGQYDRLPALADYLVRGRVAVIAAAGYSAVTAAKAATPTIPIVCVADDPVRAGLVASLNGPGGNVTGVSLMIREAGTRRFGLLAELVPDAAIIAVFVNPFNPIAETDASEAQLAARAYGRQIVLLNSTNAVEIGVAFATACPCRKLKLEHVIIPDLVTVALAEAFSQSKFENSSVALIGRTDDARGAGIAGSGNRIFDKSNTPHRPNSLINYWANDCAREVTKSIVGTSVNSTIRKRQPNVA